MSAALAAAVKATKLTEPITKRRIIDNSPSDTEDTACHLRYH